MALDVEVGEWTKDSSGTANATDTISTGFQPKAGIFWGAHQVTSDGITSDIRGNFTHGFSDGTNHRCGGNYDQNDAARVNSRHYMLNTHVIGFKNSALGGSDSAFYSRATIVYNSTPNFVVTWTVNDTTATILKYIIFGGDDITGVQVTTVTALTSNGSQSVTLDTDVRDISDGQGILFTIWGDVGNNTSADNGLLTRGAATSASEEVSISFTTDDNNNTGDPFSVISDKVIRSMSEINSTIAIDLEFTAWDSLGFDWNYINAPSNADPIYIMVIKGGQWDVGNDTMRTTDGTKATTTGFQPNGLCILGNPSITLNSVNAGVDGYFLTGASTSSTVNHHEGCIHEDASANSETGVFAQNNSVLGHYNSAAGVTTLDAEADLDSFNATDFTLDYTNTDGTAHRFGWIVCASDAGGATVQSNPSIINSSAMIAIGTAIVTGLANLKNWLFG